VPGMRLPVEYMSAGGSRIIHVGYCVARCMAGPACVSGSRKTRYRYYSCCAKQGHMCRLKLPRLYKLPQLDQSIARHNHYATQKR
jgi:hypothetical protein